MTGWLRRIGRDRRSWVALCIGLAMVFIVDTARAQRLALPEAPIRDEFSLMLGLQDNLHSADFRTLPGVPNCCPRFERGTGMGMSFFPAGYEHPINSQFGIGARLGYQSLSATLTHDENTTVLINGTSTVGTFEHTVNASVSALVLNPFVSFRPIGQWKLKAGLAIGGILSNSYAQKETLLEPVTTGTFENGTRIRNQSSGSTPDANRIYAGLSLGAGYVMPLGSNGVLSLVPEVMGILGFTPLVTGMSWRASSIMAGASIVYSPKETPTEPPPPPPPAVREGPPVKPVVKVEPPVKHPILTAELTTGTIDSMGISQPLRRLTVEEYIRTQYRPLLNFVFFDENSARIPERYALLDKQGANGFGLSSLNDLETLPLYYNVLNVIGFRMRKYPRSKITIIGCNADIGAEKANRTLSDARARTVRDYLHDVWSIDPNRLQVETRNLPEKHSSTTDPDGQAENRRVELSSTQWQVLEPMYSVDSAHLPKPSVVQFHLAVTAEAGTARWEVATTGSSRKLKDFSGKDSVPIVLNWELEKEPEAIMANLDTVTAVLSVTDGSGQAARSTEALLPVRHHTLGDKHHEGSADTIISRYSLILFDFDKADLSEANRRIASFVKERIAPDAHVGVYGYTDRTGNDEYNKQLSEARARSTQRYIGLDNADVRGLGRSVLLYDNALPEGRFYSRTVTVIVSTPTKD